MRPINDIAYKALSDKTLREIENIFLNCEPEEVADHIYTVIYEAKCEDKLLKLEDVFRLSFKFLEAYVIRKINA